MNCHRADRVGIVTVRDRRDLQTGHCQLLLSLGPGKPGSAPSSAGGEGEGLEAVAMVTQVAWNLSPIKPRVSAALELSDWMAFWALPPAPSPLRGGGVVLSW